MALLPEMRDDSIGSAFSDLGTRMLIGIWLSNAQLVVLVLLIARHTS